MKKNEDSHRKRRKKMSPDVPNISLQVPGAQPRSLHTRTPKKHVLEVKDLQCFEIDDGDNN